MRSFFYSEFYYKCLFLANLVYGIRLCFYIP